MSAAKSPWPIATAMSRGGQDGQRRGRAAASEDPQRRGAGVREPGAGQGRDACAGFAGWSARSCAGCRCVMSRRRSRRPSRSRSFSEHRVTDLRGQPRALPGVVPAWAGRAHGPPAHRRPRRIHSDRVRVADGRAVADGARRRRLGAPAPRAPPPPQRRRTDRLDARSSIQATFPLFKGL